MRYSICSSVLLACSIVAAAGCSPDKGPGSLTVDYIIGNNKSCSDVGIENLRATVYQGSIDEPTAEFTEDVDCITNGQIEFAELEPGVYNLQVVAFDNDGVAIYDNLGSTDAERRFEVFEAALAEEESSLTERPAELEVAWRLGEGGFANCGGVGIGSFAITAFQVGGGTILLEAELDCELTGNGQGYRQVLDPERNINGALFGEVGIQARAPDGSAIGDPVTFDFEPPGPGYGVQLNIECIEDGCYAQE